MSDSIAESFRRPPEERGSEPLPSPTVFWNAGQWLLIHLSHAHASHLLRYLNADETQAEIANWPTLKAIRDEINACVQLNNDQEEAP